MTVTRRRFGQAAAVGVLSAAGLSPRRGVAAGNRSPLRIVGPGPSAEGFALDPVSLSVSSAEGIGPILAAALYEGLTSLNLDGRLRPGLARSWFSKDDLEWTFLLRNGVRAESLVGYLTALCGVGGPLRDSSYLFDTWGVVSSWSVVSPWLIVARLRFPQRSFPYQVAGTVWKVPVSVCGVSGPYRVVDAGGDVGAVVSLEARAPSRGVVLREAGVRSFRVAVESSASSRFQAVVYDRADVGLSVAGPHVEGSGLGGGRLLRFRWQVCPALVATRSYYPVLDPDIPRAFKTLVDRHVIRDSVYSGLAVIANDAPIGRGLHLNDQVLDCSLSVSDSVDVLQRTVRLKGPISIVANHDEHRFLALQFARTLWRDYQVDCRSVYKPEDVGSSWEDPFIVAPWARRHDPRLLFWMLSEPSRSSVAWSTAGLRDLVHEALAASTPAKVNAAVGALSSDFSCNASAVVPVLPDRVDLLGPGVSSLSGYRRGGAFAPDDFVAVLSFA